MRESGLPMIRNQFLKECPFCGSGSGPNGTSAFHFYENGYKCFSCDETGDSIVFLERYLQLSKSDAIHMFRTKYKGEEDTFKNKNTYTPQPIKPKKTPLRKVEKYDTLGIWELDRFHEKYEEDPLTTFLISKFGKEKTIQALERYRVRTSSGGTIFPYFSHNDEFRTVKMVKYGMNGRRDRDSFPFYMHKKLGGNQFKYKRCFFGEHLLTQHDGPIAIVESEKTAIIMSIVNDEFLTLATGGKNTLHINNIYHVLNINNQRCVLFPDHDKPDDYGVTPFIQWSYMADELNGKGYDVITSEILETENTPFGYDIADVILDRYENKVRKVSKENANDSLSTDNDRKLYSNEVRRIEKSEKNEYDDNVAKLAKSNASDSLSEGKADESLPNDLAKFGKVGKVEKDVMRFTLDELINRTPSKPEEEEDLHMEAHRKKTEEIEAWNERLGRIKTKLSEISIPDHPVKIGPGHVTDIPKFINANIATAEKYPGNHIFEASLHRLEELISIIE